MATLNKIKEAYEEQRELFVSIKKQAEKMSDAKRSKTDKAALVDKIETILVDIDNGEFDVDICNRLGVGVNVITSNGLQFFVDVTVKPTKVKAKLLPCRTMQEYVDNYSKPSAAGTVTFKVKN